MGRNPRPCRTMQNLAPPPPQPITLADVDRLALLHSLLPDLPDDVRNLVASRALALFRAGYRTAGLDPPAWLCEARQA